MLDPGTSLAVSAPVSGSLRIGAFSRRVGLSAAVLRAWETRYGLFTPDRTNGGFRLYGPEEERRVRRMRALTAHGMAAAESARLVLAEAGERTAWPALAAAWRSLDADGAQQALDALLGGPEPEVAVARHILPLLAELPAERRHFAQRMVETRLLGLGTSWHDGPGPLALAGCGPGEHDTIELLVLALALRRRGWRLVYLGADTPVAVFASIAKALSPARIIVGFRDAGRAQGFDPPFDATVVCGDPLATAAALAR
jgi:MerR family transcriptional regulator, light-induced transcriptional regulator